MNMSDAPGVVPSADVDDLRIRLERFRQVQFAHAPDWMRGVPAGYMAELVEYWRDSYDWRTHESRIRSLPWQVAGGDRPLRVIHRPFAADAPTVVLLHGWPDSVLRFERVLPALTDVNVVVPALPGFPFALPVPERGMSARQMAAAVGEALADLGYDHYILSAGDIGCDVAEALAADRRGAVAALHLTDVSQVHFLVNPPTDLSPAEQDYMRRGQEWQEAGAGYMHEQRTKLQTLAVALGDSPAGTAAWILEKLYEWTDCEGDVETVFARDDLLTWISAYWFDGCIGTSFSPYAQGTDMSWARIEAPTAFTMFPKDLVNAPREFAERFFNVQHWRELERGGHFAAWERPDDYLNGVRAALDLAS